MTPLRSIPFAKVHACGNDFLLVEKAALTGAPGELARRMCHRHTGVGGDGLVTLAPLATAAAEFRIFNSDGSEATLSGNALRCAAAWLFSQGRAKAGAPGSAEQIVLDTRVGLRTLHFLGRDGAAWSFRAEMGAPRFAAEDVPFAPPSRVTGGAPLPVPLVGVELPVNAAACGKVRATILHMGNPQCIVLVDDFAAQDWRALGEELERHRWFPDRANIGFVRVLNPETIEARFWERGAGHTLASGTGSCACAVASHMNGRSGRRVRVRLEQGEMDVEWREDGGVELTGTAVIVCTGEYAA